MQFSAGARLGPYQIVAPIGAGGMGEVYRARDPRMARDVAIKILPLMFLESQERRERRAEARTTGALSHPNLLVVHDVGTEEGIPFIVSEMLEGETLRQRLQGGPLPLKKGIAYAIQIANWPARRGATIPSSGARTTNTSGSIDAAGCD